MTESGWSIRRLEEIADTYSGGTPSRRNPQYFGGNIPWAKSGEVNARVVRSTEEHITNEGLQNSSAKWVKRDSVLLAMYGATAGKVARLEIDATINQAILAITANSDLADNSYLFHALDAAAPTLLRRVQGSGQPNLSGTLVRGLEIPVPPLPEQRKIAAILSSVDATIEKTEAVIEQLQVVKKAMMQELLTRGIPGRHRRFKETEIGVVPEEWEVVRLGDHLLTPIRNGYSPRCPNEMTGKWILHLGAVGFDGFSAGAVKPAPPDDPKVDQFRLIPGDLLLSRSNTRERVGLVGIYRGDPPSCSYPDLLMRIRPAPEIMTEYLEATFLSPQGRTYFERSARGTSGSMVKVNRRIVENFKFALPPGTEQRDIVKALRCADERITHERYYRQKLQLTKSSLMSVLLTGQLRVTPDEPTA